MLTHDQNDELRRAMRQILYGTPAAINTIIDSYGPFETEYDGLVADVGIINSLEPEKGQVTHPITNNKTILKHKVADYYEPLCGRVYGFAVKFNHVELQGYMKVLAYQIFKMKDNDVLAFIILLNGYITPWLLDPDFLAYEIVAANLTTGLGLATDFDGEIGVAEVVEGSVHTAGVNIEEVFTRIATRQAQFVLLLSHYDVTQPAFVINWRANSVVVHTGHHFNGLGGKVTGGVTNVNLVATVTNVTLSREVGCDLLGDYEMVKMHPGLYEFKISCVGYVDLIVVIRILKGKILVENFHLTAVV